MTLQTYIPEQSIGCANPQDTVAVFKNCENLQLGRG